MLETNSKSMIRHYVKIAWRQILKNKTQYILSVIGIAIGLLCFSITCYYVRNNCLDYTAWENADRMGSFNTINRENGNSEPIISGVALQGLLDNPVEGIEKIAICDRWNGANVTFVKEDGEVPFLCTIAKVNESFPAVYSLRMISGEIPVLRSGEVLISEPYARKVFGTENPVGRTLYFTQPDANTETVSYSIISAVVEELPKGTQVRSDLYFLDNPINPQRFYYGTTATVLFAEGISAEALNLRLMHWKIPGNDAEKSQLQITTFYQHLLKSENLLAIILIPFIASLVLIISLINFLKLSIHTFYNRTRELCLRKSLGSGNLGLFILLFTEQVLLILLAALFSFSLTEFVISHICRILPKGVMMPVELSELLVQQLGYLVILLLICALISALAVHRIKYLNVISGIRAGGGGRHRVRNFVLGLQLVVCFFFIGTGFGAMLLSGSIDKERYNTLPNEVCERTWLVDMFEPQLQGHEQEIISQISSLSGVEEITAVSNSSSQQLMLADSVQRTILFEESNANYIGFMRLPIQGKSPSEGEIVVSEALKELIDRVQPDNNEMLVIKNRSYRITGTYKQLPFKRTTLEETSWDMYSAITHLPEGDARCYYVKCAAGQGEKIRKEILTFVRERLPDTIPYQIRSLKECNFMSYGGFDVLGMLFLVLSGVCLLITSLGLYSTITLETKRRQKEVAIRKINGAGARVILYMFGRFYLRLLVISSVIAFPILFLVLLQIFREVVTITPVIYNPLFWIAVWLLVGGIVLFTIGWRLWGVLRINPAEVIKSE